MQKMHSVSQKVAYWLKVVSLGLILGLGLQFAQAWTAPTAAPPGGNVAGPVTLGSTTQTKTGNLVLNSDNTLATGLLMYGGLNVQATTSYNGAGAEGIIHDPQSYADLVLEGKTGWGGNLRFFNNGLPRGDFSYVVTPNTGMESFRFFTGGDTNTPKMVVNNNGNVGVGTVAPGQKFSVNGNIESFGAGNGIIFPDGTKQTTAAGSGAPVGYSELVANLGEDVYGNGAKIADQTAGGGIAGTDTCNGVKGSVTSSVPCWSGGAYSRSYIVNDAGLYTCGVNETKTCTDIYLLQISSWCTNNDDGTSNNAPFYHVYSRTVECKKAAALVKYY